MKLSLCMAYYENHSMLSKHIERWQQLPDMVKEQIEFIVCDDGSPKAPADHRPTGLNFKLFRIQVDRRWNQDAARNICAKYATGDWLLLTDMDHVAPRKTIEGIMRSIPDLRRNMVYRFERMTVTDQALSIQFAESYKPHPNSWLMTREMFEKIGGYDERLSGYYGTDADFRDSVNTHAQQVVIIRDLPLLRVPREIVPDASTTTYGRKEPQDKTLGVLLRERYVSNPGWRPIRYRFPYDAVYECSI